MRYEIIFAPQAVKDFKRLSAHERSLLRDEIETHLRYSPEKTARSRIKRLLGLKKPQYRLRVGEMRVFHDIAESQVHILAIIEKQKAVAWLENTGEPE